MKGKMFVGGSSLLALVSAVILVTESEGLRLNSYKDAVGVQTVCYGSTTDPHENIKYTKRECEELFVADMARIEGDMRKCLSDPDSIPANTYAAFLSFGYNVGAKRFCQSLAAAFLNKGLNREACLELKKWVFAGGREMAGLKARRAKEVSLCLNGL